MSATEEARSYEFVVEPPRGWRLINWHELRAYKDLFYFLIARDVRVLYKQTVLGFSWAILNPMLSMIVFTVIFGKLARVSSDGVPYAIFSYTGLVPWGYFASAMTAASLSLVSNAGTLSRVYFPRLVLPWTGVFSKLVDFGIGFSITGALMAYYRVWPTASVVFLPVLVLLMMFTAAGIGMWLAALAVRYRDVRHALPFVVQVMMYAAPVVWPVSLIADRYGDTARLVYGFYPMVGVIEGFRSALLGTMAFPWDLIGAGSVSALIIFLSGALYFRRMEHTFADVA